ncbi:hypothetical protein llap_578 [Limosa lapponica baueri]|uniref:Uncharacterized protein n=1 Tax=Limosa lapponica baueri TaxID=1758121 RepID=A0A2I0USX3_LIMLA|nr:hypothetical protein llap_578 [Limosa lapponica baueri]
MTSYHIRKTLIDKAFLVHPPDTHPPKLRILEWKRLNLGSLLPTAPTDVWAFATIFCPVTVRASTKTVSYKDLTIAQTVQYSPKSQENKEFGKYGIVQMGNTFCCDQDMLPQQEANYEI